MNVRKLYIDYVQNLEPPQLEDSSAQPHAQPHANTHVHLQLLEAKQTWICKCSEMF